jgi:hypothetical protein
MVDFAALRAPFPPAQISWRIGSTNGDKTRGLALAYMDARDVMQRLDEVCGPANWQDRYEFAGPRTVCYLSIRIGDEWITKADGAGDSDVESEKGSISDALKRAAVKWGIGRYLYDVESPWVEVEPAGRSVKIKASEFRKLEAVLARAGKPAAEPRGATLTPAPRPPAEDDPFGLPPNAEALITTLRRIASPDDLKKWGADNGPAIQALGEAGANHVRQAYSAHAAWLRERQEAA